MSGGIVGEAIGAVIEVEGVREAGALGAPAAPDGHDCLNCGAGLTGPFCQQCGQAAHVHRTLMAFVHDLLHGVFHFEGRIWRTIPLLMVRPGQLTRDYVAGQRVRYVSPIALFLFSVFLLFAAVQHQPAINLGDNAKVTVKNTSNKGLAANQADLARLKAQRQQVQAQGKDTEAIDDQIERTQEAVDRLRAANGEVSAQVGKAMRSADKTRHYSDIPQLNEAIAKARTNPELALYKLQSNAYKYAWALIPLSVPLVWLLFPFSRRFGLYDHTVFVTYSLCAMSLVVVVVTVLASFNVPALWLALLYPPWHMCRQLKGAYGLTRFGALWRTGVLALGSVLALILFSLVLALLEVAG